MLIHQKKPIEKEHFMRWLKIWEQTVGSLFEGPIAEQAIQKANQIARIMQGKLAGFKRV